jgi:hypothetical protein
MLGSAAACARLLKLDAERTQMAIGIAASQPTGLREQFGTMTKPFHPGGAARVGLMSALMAKHGYTASKRALEAPLQPSAGEEADGAAFARRSTDATLRAAYEPLLLAAEAEAEPGRAAVVFERALADFPFSTPLWRRYTRFMAMRLGARGGAGGGATAAVFARALRCAPWDGELWAAALRSAERGGDAARCAELYTAARAAPLPDAEAITAVALARLEQCRRAGLLAELRRCAAEALDACDALAGDGGHADGQLRVAAGWALAEVALACDGAGAGAAAARAAWEAVLKRPAYSRSCEAWLAYAASERVTGGAAAARAVFKRSYARRLSCAAGYPPPGARCGQAAICLAWLHTEREAGSAEEAWEAENKVTPILEALAVQEEEAAAAATASMQPQAASEPPLPPRVLTAEEMRRMRREKDPHFKARDAAAVAALGDVASAKQPRADAGTAAPKPAAKRQRPAPTEAAEVKPAGGVADGAAPLAGAISGAPAVRRSPALTVFAKNLPASATPEELQTLMAGAGVTPTAVRVPRDHITGAARGFAYLECASEDDVAAMLALPPLALGDKTLQLARSNPPAAAGAHPADGGQGRRGGRSGRGGRGGRGAPRLQIGVAVAAVPVIAATGAPAVLSRNSDFRALLRQKDASEHSH